MREIDVIWETREKVQKDILDDHKKSEQKREVETQLLKDELGMLKSDLETAEKLRS